MPYASILAAPLEMPWPWRLLAGWGFWESLGVCLLITPGMMVVAAFVGESRILPLHPSRQFLSFFPGDVFLGVMTAGFLWRVQYLPHQDNWYNSDLLQGILLMLVVCGSLVVMRKERQEGFYPKRALYSPTKLYHDIGLYIGYGYLISLCLIALLGTMAVGVVTEDFVWAQLAWFLFFTCFGMVWLWLVVIDSALQPQAAQCKASSAHISDWVPCWSRLVRKKDR